MVQGIWSDLHKSYGNQDWIDKPSLFAEDASNFFPHHGELLELGAGLGQDSRFFAEAGYNVIATDIEPTILKLDQKNIADDFRERIQFQQMDLRQPFPIEDKSFDIVYAHLSLHYFDTETTKRVFAEIERVLKPGGILAFLVNSTDDPEYGTGTLLEPDFYQIEKATKRYFSIDTVNELVEKFDIKLLDNHGETYKDRKKGVHNLIRFIGKKR
ncbi:MAG: class I SAM-dependent methyltransferase [Patescibacteria group bacterium]